MRGQVIKSLGWVVCMLYIQVAWFRLSRDFLLILHLLARCAHHVAPLCVSGEIPIKLVSSHQTKPSPNSVWVSLLQLRCSPKFRRFMDVRFRFGGVAGGVNPPGFTTQIHEDGFTITVPFGYQMVVDMLHPPVIEVHNNNAQGEGPVNEVNAAQPNFTEQIVQASAHRPLYQNEVLHLLRNDTLPVRVALEQIPTAGLFMYTMELSNRRDGHRYNGHHFYSVEQLGNGEEDLRRSFVVDRHDGRVVTSRRYFMQNGNPDKFLIHYMIGDGPSDDNFPQIPVQPQP